MTPADWFDTGSKVVMGNLVGFFVMALIALRLWRMMEVNIREVKANLASCLAREAEFQRQNFILAQAAVDQASGRRHEARARAQTVLDGIAIATVTPVVSGPGPTPEAAARATPHSTEEPHQ